MTGAAAILASYVRLSTLTDGTVRVVIDVEPKDRAAAFALFDAPGAAVAVARISNKAAVEHDRRQQEQTAERKPLSLASKVALTCKQPSFWEFLRHDNKAGWDCYEGPPEERAAAWVREFCEVLSRKEIVEGSKAARFWADLTADYEHFQRSGRAA